MEATLDPVLSAPTPATTRARWAGRVLTGLPVLFLALDGVMKLVAPPPVIEASARVGVTGSLVTAVGVVELACLAIHLVPRTAALGAVLLTGFLGGAVALHARLGDPVASHTLFPVYVGALLWAGLILRDPRVRALVQGASGPSK